MKDFEKCSVDAYKSTASLEVSKAARNVRNIIKALPEGHQDKESFLSIKRSLDSIALFISKTSEVK